MRSLSLPVQWTARAVSNFEEVPAHLQNRAIPAAVPGCIHLDLLRENLIPDPYLGQNEALVQWIGRTDWEFSTSFSVSAAALEEERVDLVCEGLDTVATVLINGIEVGKSENMHVEARFEAKNALREGENEIAVRFESAALYARAMREKMGDLPNVYPDFEPYNFIRKNACNFGWDWGPTLITCGIWKPIRLEAWSVARIKSVRPLVKVANEKVAVIDFNLEVEYSTPNENPNTKDLDLLFWIYSKYAGEKFIFETATSWLNNNIQDGKNVLSVTIQQPELWWPCGYGEQPLYDFRVYLQEFEVPHSRIDECDTQIGLREVELDTSPDDVGAPWTLKVNGREIWCKGANWIPDDVFLTRASEPQRLETRLQQAADCGMNMLRIWGGGIYESEAFYSICDRLGILVWQDFLFACAAYPEEEPMRGLVEAEVRHNVARLSKHPSLVLWNGGNENIWGYFDWDWKEKIGDKTWGLGYYLDILPGLVKELDPTRPYWPGSPYSGTLDIHPNADAWGNKHMWETWNRVDHTNFRAYSPRFASEFGHQAPPTYSTIARSIPEDARNPFSPAMLSHQKADGGNDKLHSRLKEHFELPENFDDWLYLTQLMQARAMTTAVEWFRSRTFCKGALFWQLNDCWPVTSWAAIDGDGHEKPLYYAAKQFFRDRLLTIQPDGKHLALWAHNDTDTTWFSEGTICLLDMNGEEKESDGFKIFIPAREVVRICRLEGFEPTDKQSEFLTATTIGGIVNNFTDAECYWFFDIDKNLNYPGPTFEAELNGNELKITTKTLIRDLYLNADRIGGKVEFGLVTLLPGETWTVEIEGVAPEDLDLETLTSRPVLNCANYFGRKSE